ncbi:hypothetical protein KUF54_12515 [Comamonas sp. Y33R10-2]|uniref:hypothetical protein n=1 Tax=Comamonas sp. Y33R10-2 TaxID=2853257 RepID=UPI001C5C9C77|nr:hypothetical protein [Comamonas sp. Y33R10-2]QXZ08872.1 hypothetical protein KUF54_12515 [Comamonas sp. Y33R10-2]
MKQGLFESTDVPFRRGNFSCAYQWLQELTGMDELIAHLDALSAADPAHRYLSTLDDISQCSYTCGHAGQDDRLYLEESDDDAGEDDEEEEDAREAEHERASLQYRVQQLINPELMHSWQQVCGSLATSGSDVQAMLRANQAPEALLDEIVYVQRVPVAADDLKIAAQPNGYFSADWDTFQNHAIIRHLSAEWGYRFFAMGASWMGFVRATPPSAEQAQCWVDALRELYGKGNDEVLSHPGWQALAALLPERRTLMLGYTENMAEALAPEAED